MTYLDAQPPHLARVLAVLALAMLAAAPGCVIDNPDYAATSYRDSGENPDGATDALLAVDLAQPPNPGPATDVAEDATKWGGFESPSANGSYSLQVCPKIQLDPTHVALTTDSSHHQTGLSSIRVDYGPGLQSDFAVVYPKTRSGDWNITRREGLALFLDAALPMGYTGWVPGPTLILCTSTGYRKIEPTAPLVPDMRSAFIPINVPLTDSPSWQHSDSGIPDLTHVSAIEVHFRPLRDHGQGTVSVWLDGVSFY